VIQLLTGALAFALAAASAPAAKPPPGADKEYRLDGSTCDGLPRLPIGTVAGMCAGRVAAPEPGRFRRRALRMPRSLLALDDAGRDWLVTDLGDWRAGRGVLWRLRWAPGAAPVLTRLVDRLSMPHTVARGPDGRIYVGEMSRIVRIDPDAPDPARTLEPVVEGLPDNRLHDDRHPLSAFIFLPDGALLVDVGAQSDACAEHVGPDGRCTELDGPDPRAVLRRYAYLGDGRWDARFTVFAGGLRNSVALALTPRGAVLQGENSIDLDDPKSPFDEINRVEPGRFYGWPYCLDAGRPAPVFAAREPMDCRGPDVTPPLLLLPPHAAPIAMAYYRGALFPQLEGRLLMTWRGYRSPGARVVAYETDGAGLPKRKAGARFEAYVPGGGGIVKTAYALGPAGEPLVLTPRWDKVAGLRPRGAPAGMAVSPDGSIWVCDDKNGAIVRLAADRP
jgi:glucose/arabinose dehydrogenase